MNEFETLLRLAIIKHLYASDQEVRRRVARLIPMVHESCRAGLGLIVLSKSPRAVIQHAVDKW